MAAPEARVYTKKSLRPSKRTGRSPLHSSHNWMERLPSEILIRILSHLDAASLYSLSHVSSLLYQFASENSLWHKIFQKQFGDKSKKIPKFVEALLKRPTDVRDLGTGHWKWLYFKTTADYDMCKWKKQLHTVNLHTGLPAKMEQVLCNLNVSWQLSVLQKSQKQSTLDASWSKFSESSVTLCWSSSLPDLPCISALQLFGVRRLALSCTGLKQPAQRSLMVNVDMAAISESIRHIGQDGLVDVKLLQPGVVVGLWKGQCSVAFVMFCLHFHKLLERSTQGSSVCAFRESPFKPPADDIDSEFGLHGFFLNIALHNNKSRIMSESFNKLFCRKTEICNGLIQLTAISRNKLSEHIQLSSSITFPWRCEGLCGTVQDSCIMTLTLLDEFKQPLWHISTPVCLQADLSTKTEYDYQGDYFLIQHGDEDAKVKINLIYNEEQQAHTVIGLAVCISTSKINSHFGTDY